MAELTAEVRLGDFSEARFLAGGRAVVAGNDGVALVDLNAGSSDILIRSGAFYPALDVSSSLETFAALDSPWSSELHVWRAADLRLIGRVELPATVLATSFSPDSGHLLLATGDGLYRLVPTLQAQLELLSQRREFRSVRHGPNGRLAVTGAHTWVEVWDLAKGEVRHQWEAERGYVLAVAFAPTGKLVASGGEDGSVSIRSLEAPRSAQVLSGHRDHVSTLDFNPLVRRLASGGEDGTLRVWDLPTGNEVLRLHAHEGEVSSVRWSPDGLWLLTLGRDGALRLWRISGAEGYQPPALSVWSFGA